jgi:hypothetical protein
MDPETELLQAWDIIYRKSSYIAGCISRISIADLVAL